MQHSVVSLFILFFVVFTLNGCGESAKSTEDYIARAKGYQGQGDYKAAVIELKNALRQSPDSAEARMLLGFIYADAGDGASAEKELLRSADLGMDPRKIVVPLLKAQLMQSKFKEIVDSAIDTKPLGDGEQVTLSIVRGDAQRGLGELDAAEAMYDTAIALQPDSAAAGLGKAHVAADRNQLTKARELLDSVVKVHDDFAPAWSFLAGIEQYEGNIQAAEGAYSKALELRPRDINDLANRALVRLALNNIPGATLDINATMAAGAQQSGQHALAFFARGQLYFTQKKYVKAAENYEIALKRAPDYLPARFFLAVAQYWLGLLEQADQNVSEFRFRAPQFTGGHRLYAAVKYSQGDYDEAQVELENLLSFDPDDAWSLDLLADIAVMKGNPDQAIENYRRLVALHPDSGEMRINLALGLMTGDSNEARQVLNEAVALGNGPPQAKQLIVVSAMKAGEWDEAIVAAETLVAEDPGNWDAFTLLGGAYLGKGDADKAREMFEEALKLNPGNPNAANNLARLELNAGNEAAARDLYEAVLARDSSQTTALLSLSALDYRQGKFQEAIERMEVGLNKYPQDMALRLGLARLYLRTGQPSANLTLVYEAVEEQANHPLMLQVLGDSQSALGDFAAAEVSYKKAVSLVPESATGHYLLARTYAALDKFDRAHAQLERVIELEPDHFAASVMRIRLLRMDRQAEEALQLLKELDPAYSKRPEVLVEKGWLAMYQHQYAEATRAFEQAFELVPGSDLVIQLGIAKWNTGDEEGALEGYRSWLRANPADTQVLFHLANGYLQLGRNERAVAAYQKLLGQKPDDPIVLNNIAWLLRDSDPKQALKLARRTTNIAPEWPSGIDTLGVILLAQGETSEAYQYFEQALQHAPDDPEIRYHLALASSTLGEKAQALQILKAVLADPAAEFESKRDAEKLFRSLQE